VASVALIIFVLVPVMANQLAAILPPEGEKALGDATLDQIRTALDRTGLEGLPVCDAPAGRAALDHHAGAHHGRRRPALRPHRHRPRPRDGQRLRAPGRAHRLLPRPDRRGREPEEVAAVFAHELGHVVARDPARGALRTAGSIGVLGLLFGDFAGGAAVLFLAERLIEAATARRPRPPPTPSPTTASSRWTCRPARSGTFFVRLRARYGDAEGIVAHFLSHPRSATASPRAEAAGAGQGARGPR
jgi:beta-barrel assembly-enhancing protease